MIPMELKKLGNGNGAVGPAFEWKKMAAVARNRRATLFASGFAITLFVCTLFLALSGPNKLVTNPMDQGQSWFPSMLRNSSGSRSFLNFFFSNSDSSVKGDNSTQDPQNSHQSVVDNSKDGLKNNGTDSPQGLPLYGGVPSNSTDADLVQEHEPMVPEDGLNIRDAETNSTHEIPFNGSVPIADTLSIPPKNNESMVDRSKGMPEHKDTNSTKEPTLNGSVPIDSRHPDAVNVTSSSASTQRKPFDMVSSNSTVTPDLSSNITESKGAKVPDGLNITDTRDLKPSNVPSGTAEKKCNIFSGRWVPDDTKPLYPAGSCPHIDESFNCFRNRRPDHEFEKWRWQPNDCDIPRFNATDMLERLRGKRLSFVGDSLNRNMWESMVCSLRHAVANKSRVYEISGRKQFRAEGFYAFRYEDYNCSVEFIRAPFLVREWEVDEGNGTKKETLRLDLMDTSTSKYRKSDIIVFNTGHWWTHEKTSKGKDYYQEGDHVYPDLKVLEAYRKALKTWAKWVDKKINPNRTQVFFRGYSATHFSGGQWNSGGQCHKESEPIYNDTYLTKYNPKMEVLESVIQEMKVPVMYLNITRMTDYRKDAHPSIYRKQFPSQEERIQEVRYQDCSHWCLPGVPDTWNELLYASLLMAGRGVWAT
ncbi:protein trichome birefringence-like 2 [Cryptomeria japonica]|uniref:protein trichome birefringence-like 2 n=1 Tax=Cryptomeria japonica TaxID=3369 RepID=UPI0027DA776F|nr:protein trichome birefringence-like 2 [Cryptomeria japonica]